MVGVSLNGRVNAELFLPGVRAVGWTVCLIELIVQHDTEGEDMVVLAAGLACFAVSLWMTRRALPRGCSSRWLPGVPCPFWPALMGELALAQWLSHGDLNSWGAQVVFVAGVIAATFLAVRSVVVVGLVTAGATAVADWYEGSLRVNATATGRWLLTFAVIMVVLGVVWRMVADTYEQYEISMNEADVTVQDAMAAVADVRRQLSDEE